MMDRNGVVSPTDSQSDPYSALSREDLIVATRACCLTVEIHSTTGKEEHRVAVDYTRAGITYSGSQGGGRCIEGREGETGVVL